MGHNVLVFNYRGFGRSEGIASENGFYRDAEAAYQYLRDIKGLKDDQIVAMGYSLGSAPATDLSSYHKIDLFLDRAFSSMKDVAYDIASNKMKLGFIGGCIAKAVFYLGGADFDLKEKIKSVEGRIFVSTANRDTTMSAFHSKLLEKSLADKTKEDVSFEEVDSDHIHYSCSDLWFHHDNYYNKEKRRLLEVFLNGNAIAQIKTFSFWRRCLEFAKSLI
jgi:alpha/beta superfamily hydrolase